MSGPWGNVDEFEVMFDALDSRVFKAQKYFLSRASDSMARLYNLELRIDNPEGEILPDMFARVDIVKQEKADALAVPLYSIITLNNEQTVYVVSENTVNSRAVTTASRKAGGLKLPKGLKPEKRWWWWATEASVTDRRSMWLKALCAWRSCQIDRF